jgi:hypothetical protein
MDVAIVRAMVMVMTTRRSPFRADDSGIFERHPRQRCIESRRGRRDEEQTGVDGSFL